MLLFELDWFSLLYVFAAILRSLSTLCINSWRHLKMVLLFWGNKIHVQRKYYNFVSETLVILLTWTYNTASFLPACEWFSLNNPFLVVDHSLYWWQFLKCPIALGIRGATCLFKLSDKNVFELTKSCFKIVISTVRPAIKSTVLFMYKM